MIKLIKSQSDAFWGEVQTVPLLETMMWFRW